ARNTAACRSRSPASASLSRSWMTSTPAARIASRKSGRSGLGPVTTYSRAFSSRPRLSTGHSSHQLEAIAVGEDHLAVPPPLERLAVVLDHHERGVEAAQPDERIDAGAGRDIV